MKDQQQMPIISQSQYSIFCHVRYKFFQDHHSTWLAAARQEWILLHKWLPWIQVTPCIICIALWLKEFYFIERIMIKKLILLKYSLISTTKNYKKYDVCQLLKHWRMPDLQGRQIATSMQLTWQPTWWRCMAMTIAEAAASMTTTPSCLATYTTTDKLQAHSSCKLPFDWLVIPMWWT